MVENIIFKPVYRFLQNPSVAVILITSDRPPSQGFLKGGIKKAVERSLGHWQSEK